MLKKALKEKIHEPDTVIRVLNAERTFLEKATIFHQYAHLPEDKKLPPRISRHFYDFFRLINSSIKKQALEEIALLERVANHKSIYFAQTGQAMVLLDKEFEVFSTPSCLKRT